MVVRFVMWETSERSMLWVLHQTLWEEMSCLGCCCAVLQHRSRHPCGALRAVWERLWETLRAFLRLGTLTCLNCCTEIRWCWALNERRAVDDSGFVATWRNLRTRCGKPAPGVGWKNVKLKIRGNWTTWWRKNGMTKSNLGQLLFIWKFIFGRQQKLQMYSLQFSSTESCWRRRSMRSLVLGCLLTYVTLNPLAPGKARGRLI